MSITKKSRTTFWYGLLSVSLMILMSSSCRWKSSDETKTSDTAAANLDFATFYEKFHNDSAYQMSHIFFPLEGQPSNIENDSIVEGFAWYESDWTIHQSFDESEYQVFRDKLGDALVIELVCDEQGHCLERTFSIIDNRWMLIKYNGLRKVE